MLIRGQPSLVSANRVGVLPPVTLAGVVARARWPPSRGGGPSPGSIQLPQVLGVARQTGASSFRKQPGAGWGACWWLPAHSRENQPIRHVAWHTTGGQGFERTRSGPVAPCGRMPACTGESGRGMAPELRPGVWELSQRKLWRSKLTYDILN